MRAVDEREIGPAIIDARQLEEIVDEHCKRPHLVAQRCDVVASIPLAGQLASLTLAFPLLSLVGKRRPDASARLVGFLLLGCFAFASAIRTTELA